MLPSTYKALAPRPSTSVQTHTDCHRLWPTSHELILKALQQLLALLLALYLYRVGAERWSMFVEALFFFSFLGTANRIHNLTLAWQALNVAELNSLPLLEAL